MMCFVCMVHYCYSRGGEVIQALISHQGEHTWFIWAFSRQLLCLFFSFHFIMMTSTEKCLYGEPGWYVYKA